VEEESTGTRPEQTEMAAFASAIRRRKRIVASGQKAEPSKNEICNERSGRGREEVYRQIREYD
jgi:hypothetical protein